MDYEKMYRDLIKRLKEERDGDNDYEPFCHVANEILDEFGENESEDERIRREIIDFIQWAEDSGMTRHDYHQAKRPAVWIAYLEKQKEQKPAEWNDADMREARQNLIVCCRDWERGENTTLLPIVATRARYFLEHLTEPKPAEYES